MTGSSSSMPMENRCAPLIYPANAPVGTFGTGHCGRHAKVDVRCVPVGSRNLDTGGLWLPGVDVAARRRRVLHDNDRFPAVPVTPALERDEEKWNPVLLANHATTQRRAQDDVSMNHHPALVQAYRGPNRVDEHPVIGMIALLADDQMRAALISRLRQRPKHGRDAPLAT